MWICALTGGIGSGKSSVARCLQDLGVQLLFADELAKAVLAPHSPGLAQVVSFFGPDLVGPNHELNRKALAKLVFEDKSAKAKLEHIVHPRVHEAFLSQSAALKAQGTELLIYEIPLLVETGRTRAFDQVIAVTAPKPLRTQRVMQRNQLTQAQVHARMAAQALDQARIDAADFVLHNDGELADLPTQVSALLDQLRARLNWKKSRQARLS